MGVTGLWRLLEPAGKPVPLETLENKVLAVDISIWLHQMVKGYHDPRGGAVTNAHLMGLFQRLCKLMYYRIKPVFVFDGGVPTLKKMTIIKRQNKKSQMHNTVDQMRKQLLGIVTKQMAVNKVLSEKAKSPNKKSPVKAVIATGEEENLFKLPPIAEEIAAADTEEDSDSEESSVGDSHSHIDLHSLDVNSSYFKNLTPREKHDLLTELKETRKQSSWGRIHELPSQSDNFSNYQMQRLLKRRQVQVSLEETEKEMGGHYLSLNELEVLLNEEGIDTKIENIPSRRIASTEHSNFVLIKDVKEALDTATKIQLALETAKKESEGSTCSDNSLQIKLGEEFDEDLEAAIKLSLQCSDDNKASTSTNVESNNVVDLTFLSPDFVDNDSEWSTDEDSENEFVNVGNKDLALAKAYMLQNSGLSEYEILRIINSNVDGKSKRKLKTKKSKPSVLNMDTNFNTPVPIKENSEIIVIENKTEVVDNTEIGNLDKHQVNLLNSNCNIPTENYANFSILKKDEVQNFSSSDTDESFEDVPDITQPAIELEIKTENAVIGDDIFSDIFEKKIINKQKKENSTVNDTLKSNELDKKVSQDVHDVENYLKNSENSHNPSSMHVNTDVFTRKISMIEKDVLCAEDNIKNTICPDEFSAHTLLPAVNEPNSEILETTVSEQISPLLKTPLSSESETQLFQNSSLISELSPQKEIIEFLTPKTSPQKGMTLNEIRHIISQDTASENPSVENNFIAKQMISTEDLSILADDLEVERDKIEKQQNKLDRMGRNISEEMTRDAQDLLQMFGVPYIIAPMEAEAQCAFLESIKLTDGTITDDSDIWLFGGKSVYKNFFNQQKYVLQFLSENIQSCFKLSREQLILLAMLVGSDYTTGVNGIGPVTALEILAAFPALNTDADPPYVTLLQGLRKFRTWWSNKRSFGHTNLRNKLKNISLSQEFPNHRVVEAYLSPEVNKDKETFSWGKPDTTALREFTRVKFGWSQAKTDEILNPVLKRLDEKISQQSIRSFFRTEVNKTTAEENMSKRVKMAVGKMGNDNEQNEEELGLSKPKKARKTKDSLKSKITKKDTKTKTDSSLEITNTEKPVISIPSTSEPKNITSTKCAVQTPFIPERYQEVIPQREFEKSNLMKNKMKAIELYRTSQKGPGFTKKRKKQIRKPKADAELSESSSD